MFVQDSSGNQSFVAGASVKFSGPATFETESDENGRYVIAAVPSGTYSVEAIFPGLKAVREVHVEGSEAHVLLELKPSEVTASVEVKADQTQTNDPAPSETISDKTLRDAPNVNERFESALPLVPGVVRGPDGNINLRGARWRPQSRCLWQTCFHRDHSDAVSRRICESARTNNARLVPGARTNHRLDLYAWTYSHQPTPGQPLSIRFRPLPSLDHAGFRVAHGTRSRRLASSKIHDHSAADRVEAGPAY